jgi:hypothetical protein
MIRKYFTAFILLIAAWYAFLASRSLEKTAEYAFRDVYEIGDKFLVRETSGSGSYINVDIFEKVKLPAWKAAIDSHDYKWLDTNTIRPLNPFALEILPEGYAKIGDFNFDGIIEVATFGSESFFERSPTSPVFIDRSGRILEMDPLVPKAIFALVSITGNLLFLLLFVIICFVTMMLWFIFLLGKFR